MSHITRGAFGCRSLEQDGGGPLAETRPSPPRAGSGPPCLGWTLPNSRDVTLTAKIRRKSGLLSLQGLHRNMPAQASDRPAVTCPLASSMGARLAGPHRGTGTVLKGWGLTTTRQWREGLSRPHRKALWRLRAAQSQAQHRGQGVRAAVRSREQAGRPEGSRPPGRAHPVPGQRPPCLPETNPSAVQHKLMTKRHTSLGPSLCRA